LRRGPLSASTIVGFGALSVVSIATHLSEAAPWLWQTSPVATAARLRATFGSAAVAGSTFCVAASAALAVGLGAEVSTAIQLVPQFTALIAAGVVVGAIAPRRPGRLLGDLGQLVAVLVISALALYGAGVVSEGLAVQSAVLTAMLMSSVAGAAQWRSARAVGA